MRSCCSLFVIASMLAACGGSTGDGVPTPGPAPSSSSPPDATNDPTADPTTSPTATPASSSGSPATSSADGTPTRVACTNSFGSTMTTDHGRLDGYLVSVVPPNTHQCNGDTSHLHLQVKAGGAVYDVAVNVDGLEAEADAALPGSPWAEGWHPGDELDYPKDLALHAPAFTLTGLSAVRQRVENAIASANHVSIYATGYGPTGGHLIHRQGSGRDGAIVIDPLSAKPHVLAFRFDTQTF